MYSDQQTGLTLRDALTQYSSGEWSNFDYIIDDIICHPNTNGIFSDANRILQHQQGNLLPYDGIMLVPINQMRYSNINGTLKYFKISGTFYRR